MNDRQECNSCPYQKTCDSPSKYSNLGGCKRRKAMFENYKNLSKEVVNDLFRHISKKECIETCKILLEEAKGLPDETPEPASPFATLPEGVPCPEHLLPKGCINNPWKHLPRTRLDSAEEFIDYIVKRIEGYQTEGKIITEEYGVFPASPTGFATITEEHLIPVVPVEWIRFCAKEIKEDIKKHNGEW